MCEKIVREVQPRLGTSNYVEILREVKFKCQSALACIVDVKVEQRPTFWVNLADINQMHGGATRGGYFIIER